MSEGNGEVMIETSGLTKWFGPYRAVEDVSFKVPRGQVAAFVGPNGAGKTTTMRILTGYVTPTSGRASIAGFDLATHRIEAASRVGYLPENGPLYPDMTPRSLLTFFGTARGLDSTMLEKRIDSVTELAAIRPVMDKPIHKLSKGYRQRVGMANAILHEPEVMILDEPTSGLDPNQIREVRKTIRELGKTRTILLSTHILREVEVVADRLLFIHEGRIVYDGPPDKMRTGTETLDEAFYRLTEKKA